MYHHRSLSLQNSSNDEAKGPENSPPERAFAAIDEEADDAEDDGARDDEFHVMFFFDEWFGKLAYSPVETPRASSVARSGAPVGAKPFCSWNARIALRDPFPHTPSGVPASNPPAFSMVWMAR